MPVTYRGGGGGSSTLAGLTDAGIVSAGVGRFLRYSNGKWRDAAPQTLNLWDYIVDGLAGSAYSPSYKFYGMTWTTANGSVTAGFPQFNTTLHNGKSITLWRANSSTSALTNTLSFTSSTAFTFGATPANAQTLVGEGHIEGTDVTTYFQAALDAAGAYAMAVGGGAIVDIPAGVWLVAGNLSIPDNVWIRGAGRNATTILLKSGVAGTNTDVFRTQSFATWTGNTAATNANRGAYGFRVSDLCIDGNFRNNETNGRYGLAIFGFDYELHNLLIRNCRDSGWYTEAAFSAGDSAYAYGVGPGGVHFYVNRLMVMNCGTNSAGSFTSYSAQVLGPHDCLLDGLDVYKVGNTTTGALLISDKNGSFSNGQDSSAGFQGAQIHVWGNHGYGIDIGAFTGYVKLSDCQFDAPLTGLRVRSNGCSVRDSRFYSVVGSGTATNVGIEIAQAKMFTAEGCHFEDLGGGAIKWTGSAAGNAGATIEGKYSYDVSTYDYHPPIETGTRPDDARVNIPSSRGEGERDIIQDPRPTMRGFTVVEWEEHFVNGNVSSGSIGRMCLGASSNATNTLLASEADHPGIIRIPTAATGGNIAYLTDRGTASVGTVLPGEEQIWFKCIFRLNLAVGTDTNARVRIGLMTDPSTGTQTDGIYFEKLDANTSYHAVARASSTETGTNTDTTVAPASLAWTTVEIMKGSTGAAPSSTAWKLYLNGTLQATYTSNIPTAVLKPGIQVRSNDAVDRQIEADYMAFSMKTTA